ncbi:DUF1273 domain-containing protein [Paenibacillus timonensis]|uniref:DUF1273 domain-containing protein n=2 Tax=Paenibacillus TaxID=44249 RepID=A0ABW3SIK3_9BACL|nr:DUF1273 domain-containing protein [Paenibacillus timonensis]MCH1642399.1 DUF1273 domain-containing protein [Paenibacillus timonensis]
MKNLLVTGYRAHELGIYGQKHPGIPYIRQAIASRLIPLLEEGLEWVITPGQYGVDLWACEAVFDLKKRYPQLKCSIITAYSHQEEKWSDEKKDYYMQILRQVDHYAAASKESYVGPWQFTGRDELLFRKTDGLLLVYDEDAGEASPKFFKERALKKQAQDGYVYLNIGSEEIQAIANEEQERAYADSDIRPEESDPV